jgi:hypothetical protein
MRLKNYWCKACLVVVLASLAAGCTREDVSGGAGEPVALTGPAAVSAPPGPPVNPDFNVMLAPDSPGVRDALRVISLDGAPIESYRWEVNNLVIEGESSASLAPGIARKGDTVSVAATALGSEARAAALIANSPPKILELPFAPADYYRGVDITVTPRAEDPDDDPVSFSYLWFVNDEELPWESGATLPGERFRRGDRLALQVTPFDGEVYGEVFRSRALVVPNAPPNFVSTPPESFESRIYRYQAIADDADGDALTYLLAAGPAGMRINEKTGEVLWTIGADQSGEQRVRLEVQDEAGDRAFQEYTITISLTEQARN